MNLDQTQTLNDIEFNPPSTALTVKADKKEYIEAGKTVKEIILTCTMP